MLLVVAALFFALSLGASLFWFSFALARPLALVLGADVVFLGVMIAAADAFDEGDGFRLDAARSAAGALLAALVFGVIVVVATAPQGWAGIERAALMVTLVCAVGWRVFHARFEALLDRLVLHRRPYVADARETLRETVESLPRAADAPDLAALNEAEFARLTRRALSALGDLPRLAASPLTQLPQVTASLRAEGQRPLDDNPLNRAAILRDILIEKIVALRPSSSRAGETFGATDSWRFYNALYYPYVVGLKPYSTRGEPIPNDPAAKAALAWFQSQVPERTLHNWQTTAARLIAKSLAGTLQAPSPAQDHVRRAASPQMAADGSQTG
jgi:hypothetical protein